MSNPVTRALVPRLHYLVRPVTPLQSVAIAAVCSGLASAVRFVLDPYLIIGVPYPTYYVALCIATLVAGFWSGLLTYALGFLLAWYLWVPPRFSFDVNPGVLVLLLTYLGVGGILLIAVGLLREALVQLRKEAEARATLTSELAHRLKNQLGVFAAIAKQTIRNSPDTLSAEKSLEGRLVALGKALNLVLAKSSRDVAFAELVESVVQPLAPARHRLDFRGDYMAVSPEEVTGYALVLHELATNALKHGAWKGADGKVKVGWCNGTDALQITWEETGVSQGIVKQSGFGSKLIQSAISGSEVCIDPQGDTYRVAISVRK